MLKKSLLILSVFAALGLNVYADHTITRRYIDRHCNSHIVYVRVDDEGNEEVENDVIIGTTTPCHGDGN